jgi:protein involved in polysaccharide export with SLBB domain
MSRNSRSEGNAMRTVRDRWFLLVLVLAGCAAPRENVRQALNGSPPASYQAYRVACSDVIQVAVAGKPKWTGSHVIRANGCIDLPEVGRVRVEGMCTDEIQASLSDLGDVDKHGVQAAVALFSSQHVYVFGEVTGKQRAVAYEGPETVVQLLRRIGGITHEGAPEHVRVVRNPCLEKARPEVHYVDLRAILLDNDQRTNITIQPHDSIYIPETRQARLSRCFHPWFRWLAGIASFGR